MKKVGVEVSVRIFTEDQEMTLRAVTNVVLTAAGVMFAGHDYTLKFKELTALEAET